MTELFSMEFWIALLFIINFIFVVFLFLFVKKINRLNFNHGETSQKEHEENFEDSRLAADSASGIVDMLEPLVKESQQTALSFDKQIKEKKRLIKELNDALDSRIISINLLLSRADALHKKIQVKKSQPDLNLSSNAVLDQQNQIIEMYNQDYDVDSIAQELSIPKGEVLLVIDLKKRFIAMEKNGR
ncbi:MAG: hypothetical protein GY857_19140 [Desulfobacula sp.]|nr:hypothetical protein [Desulfobacula sp.]